MRKAQRDAAQRQISQTVLPVSSRPEELDPEVKDWLDNVIIPILLKKLRQEWDAEKLA